MGNDMYWDSDMEYVVLKLICCLFGEQYVM